MKAKSILSLASALLLAASLCAPALAAPMPEQLSLFDSAV